MKGITIKLYEKTKTGEDGFGEPEYTETATEVENVLVGSPTEQEIVDTLNFYGKKVIYVLGIPKGDAHDWESGHTVEFFEQKWKTIGKPIQGIEYLTPTKWNKKVRVEAYE